jgi:hypothetical protein
MTGECPFSRNTILAAASVLSPDAHAKFERLMLDLGLENTPAGRGPYLSSREASFSEFCVKEPQFETPHGPLADVVVRAACEQLQKRIQSVDLERYQGQEFAVPASVKLLRGLQRDGFTLDERGLRRAFPDQVDLSAASSEVYDLLDRYSFSTAKGHIVQAIDMHSRGHWAGANSQLRAFLEGLLDEIAERLAPNQARGTPTGHPRRRLLASLVPPFLFGDLNEWTSDGKNFIEGVFKRLHPHGSHPGLSDEEDATFRLHLILILGRLFLRRLAGFAK